MNEQRDIEFKKEKPYEIESVVIGEHEKDCKAIKWQQEYGYEPWNVLNLEPMRLGDKGTEDQEQVKKMSTLHLWYEMKCGDNACQCKKRVRAAAIASI